VTARLVRSESDICKPWAPVRTGVVAVWLEIEWNSPIPSTLAFNVLHNYIKKPASFRLSRSVLLQFLAHNIFIKLTANDVLCNLLIITPYALSTVL